MGVHPAILVCSSPPGNHLIHGESPLNISSDNLVLYKISPIQIKSGNAVSVQLEAPVHIVVIIASPAGREVNNSIPIHATPIRDRPTQTELPNKKNNEKRNITVV